jgi:hypothetical protein
MTQGFPYAREHMYEKNNYGTSDSGSDGVVKKKKKTKEKLLKIHVLFFLTL